MPCSHALSCRVRSQGGQQARAHAPVFSCAVPPNPPRAAYQFSLPLSLYLSLSLSLSLICPFACQKTCAGQALTMSNISDILRSRCLPAARAGVRARVSFP